mgnify:FL=1
MPHQSEEEYVFPGLLPEEKPDPIQGYLPGFDHTEKHEPSQETLPLAQQGEIHCAKAHASMTAEEAFLAVLGKRWDNADAVCERCSNPCYSE